MFPQLPRSTLFPYTTLFRSTVEHLRTKEGVLLSLCQNHKVKLKVVGSGQYGIPDRKSTRLNSSHPSISYAVFCLKKKKRHVKALVEQLHHIGHLHLCKRRDL